MRPPRLNEYGGAEGTRTHDILLAKQALYQLSYGPGLPPKKALRKKNSAMKRAAGAWAPALAWPGREAPPRPAP